MIKKLKIKFITLSLGALLTLLLLMVMAMNIINYNSIAHEADRVLDVLNRADEFIPDFEGSEGRLPPGMSPEVPHESRYFTVTIGETCEIINVNTSKIYAINEAKAIEYAKEVYNSHRQRGYVDNLRFAVTSDGVGMRITFLDWGRKLDSFNGFLLTSSTISLAAFVLISLVVFLLSGKILRPVAESYEKQKRFITDAGHEIKTPLTIINANVDILAMEIGENESLEDIQKQTKRLTVLTNDLVYLARMEEERAPITKIDFPISEIVYDTAESFEALAQTSGKTLKLNIEPFLTLCGDGKAIAQLTSILMDNALKYSPENSTVILNMARQGRYVLLTVTNRTVTPVDERALERIFDRFYRTDPSRNSETGGHGIGLSVAHAIVTAHGGKIEATTREDGRIFEITASLPI